MPFQAVPHTAEVKVDMLLNGEIVENSFYVHNDGDWTPSTLAEVSNAMLVWLAAQYAPNLSIHWSVVSVTSTDLSTETGAQNTSHPGEPIVGARGGGVQGNNVAFVIKHTTGVRGRNYRGRTFVPGIDGSDLEGSALSAGRADALVSAFDTWDNAVTTLGYTPVVVSRRSNGVPRPNGISTAITGNSYTDRALDSQRCRLPNHRRHRRAAA